MSDIDIDIEDADIENQRVFSVLTSTILPEASALAGPEDILTSNLDPLEAELLVDHKAQFAEMDNKIKQLIDIKDEIRHIKMQYAVDLQHLQNEIRQVEIKYEIDLKRLRHGVKEILEIKPDSKVSPIFMQAMNDLFENHKK